MAIREFIPAHSFGAENLGVAKRNHIAAFKSESRNQAGVSALLRWFAAAHCCTDRMAVS